MHSLTLSYLFNLLRGQSRGYSVPAARSTHITHCSCALPLITPTLSLTDHNLTQQAQDLILWIQTSSILQETQKQLTLRKSAAPFLMESEAGCSPPFLLHALFPISYELVPPRFCKENKFSYFGKVWNAQWRSHVILSKEQMLKRGHVCTDTCL